MSSFDELRLGVYGRELMSSVDDRSGPSSEKKDFCFKELCKIASFFFGYRYWVVALEEASYMDVQMARAHSCVADELSAAVVVDDNYC